MKPSSTKAPAPEVAPNSPASLHTRVRVDWSRRSAGLRCLNWQGRGRSADPPRRPSTRTRAAVQSWAVAVSVKLRTHATSVLSPSLLPTLASVLPPLRKGQAEGGGGGGGGGVDAASLPSIWCCMPLSGCQPAHSNEGCHQGYCMLERCLLLLASLSFFILFVRDTRRIYTTATHQQSP